LFSYYLLLLNICCIVAAPGDGVISPSELAILDCLINGGKILSLKVYNNTMIYFKDFSM
jgi:hypothetical protein